MTSLRTINGLSNEHAELLSSAGIRSLGHMARENPSHLHSRLELIAWQRTGGRVPPELTQVEKWVAFARIALPAGEEPLELEHLPEAISDNAVALPQLSGPTQPAWTSPVVRAAPETLSRPTPLPQAHNTWQKLDPSKFATIEEYNEGLIGIQQFSRESINDPQASGEAGDKDEAGETGESAAGRVQRIKGGKGGVSRWVRRGVVHTRPVHTWIGALVSVLWRVAVVCGTVGLLHLLTDVENPRDYKQEILVGSGILIILSAMQLHFGGRSRCRICSCNLYYSKSCLKNSKAHLILGFGYVASAALHLLIFGWFRCMYCGTAIRLKPSPHR